MQKITSVAELKNATQFLEVEQTNNWQLLKEQFHFTYQSLKPVNILKNTLNKAVSSPKLIENILGLVAGLATGYLSNETIVSTTGNLVRKLIGTILQLGITKIAVQGSDIFRSFGQFLFQHLFSKKEMKFKNDDS
jgi:hypothetical protein